MKMKNDFKLDIPDTENYGCSSEKDLRVWEELSDLNDKFPHSFKHISSLFTVYTRRIHLIRFLAHYELFKLTTDIPGSIIDLGVYRGGSFFVWHKLLEIFNPTDTSKKVYGFEGFQGLSNFDEKDGNKLNNVGKSEMGWNSGSVEQEIMKLCEIHNMDNILAKTRSKIIKGDIFETLQPFLTETPGLRISLLHFDVDLYSVTKFSLEKLYDLVVPGGVIVFDEYALPPWEGETRAFDEFVKERNLNIEIKKLPWSLTPNAYIIKK
jgi:hypothetical protein